jgi:3',5'-nucleoside bisphosphate phosphatase
VIDLHTHTTASDGRLDPADLVARAAAAGLTVIGITDHDTTAGLAAAHVAARRAGLTLIDGIEITAVEDEQDIHVLGYFFDPANQTLAGFLAKQRADRVRRVIEMADRLRSLGYPIDNAALIEGMAGSTSSVGRPHLADALVAAGHVRDRGQAFELLIGRGRPAFVPRCGAPAADVIGTIKAAGGLASMAHPGLTARDDLLPALAASGLDALEARHSEHDAVTEQHYRQLAAALGLAVSGGSDFHGDDARLTRALGLVTLAVEDFAALRGRKQ